MTSAPHDPDQNIQAHAAAHIDMDRLWGASNKDKSQAQACNCVGPRYGFPLCPCAMRGVIIEDGRYVRKQDLGPVVSKAKSDASQSARAELSALLADDNLPTIDAGA